MHIYALYHKYPEHKNSPLLKGLLLYKLKSVRAFQHTVYQQINARKR